MTKLSVNINKIATLRNARGGNIPNVIQAAKNIQLYGAHGITVHPRPDERHIRYSDVRDLKPIITTELNIEGNPTSPFIDLVLEVKPHQVTLVPDLPEAITSDSGWDTIKHQKFLQEIIEVFQKQQIRVSIFVDPYVDMVSAAMDTGTNRIELYTESYASKYHQNPKKAIEPYHLAAKKARELNLGINAGHDLDLKNLAFFKRHISDLIEVSIGHALISDSLYFGLENVIGMYLNQLQ
ncbi:MAG: pyridoxine 5'-phosphate synthase [Flavobacteriaceae bacterium]|nr:pyridoxine 5'-phosphate synthase [Flavobacteriaceae bacterium]MCY4267479.1 pyridoxine 5'-phosphate synthase [Flavobacteriaceae bacterium]MCY4298297.1 pyridoxine 5'-phosphate synthase [Flavobacteriaceae bacterium]